MCLEVPGRILELGVGRPQSAAVDVAGVRRVVDCTLLDGEPLAVGDWVSIHAGLALARLDEEGARLALASLAVLGRDDEGLGARAADLEQPLEQP